MKENKEKRKINFIFLIDNSGSMIGERINAVNESINNMLCELFSLQNTLEGFDIYLSMLIFSNDTKCVYDSPKYVKDFKWDNIDIDSTTNLQKTYDSLNRYLNKINDDNSNNLDIPIIIMMSDGMPSNKDWEYSLNVLKENILFKYALKYALALGIDTDYEMHLLGEFTGDEETVIKIYTTDALVKVINTITVESVKKRYELDECDNSSIKQSIKKILRNEYGISYKNQY